MTMDKHISVFVMSLPPRCATIANDSSFDHGQMSEDGTRNKQRLVTLRAVVRELFVCWCVVDVNLDMYARTRLHKDDPGQIRFYGT